ncbi:cell wall-active antibiotics response protein LiaF [Lacticigenium naphthae]|uniref:cell wall-active antibiotics response protein LiaF n=1 Tax=Lacticigenium naphthae TaxID=515351 RepID=UPI00041C6336|nr:cell wall-active antibiotics response protein LiaF [Lacticigenium naphthae]
MKWKFFAIIEIILSLWLIFQLTNRFFLLFMVVAGLVLIVYKSKQQSSHSDSFHHSFLGITLIGLALFSTTAFWLMGLVFGIFLFVNLSTFKKEGWGWFWKKKQFVSPIEINENETGAIKQKQQWIGHYHIGQSVYEWHDINFTQLAGDTLIDLGNTILPKSENVIVIRKGFGRTRLFIPEELAYKILFSTMYGTFTLNNDSDSLVNENILFTSSDYSTNSKKIKIFVNAWVGDFEVISI